MKTASIVCLLSCCAALLAGRPLTDVSLPGRSVGAAEANELIGGQCAKLNNISYLCRHGEFNEQNPCCCGG